MAKTIQELRDERNVLIRQAREICPDSETAVPADKQEQFRKIMSRVSDLKEIIQREEILLEEEARDNQLKEQPQKQVNREEKRDEPKPITVEVRGQKFTYNPGTEAHYRASEEYRAAFANYAITGQWNARALQADVDTAGGFLVPTQFVAELIKEVDNVALIRMKARKFTLNMASSMGAPALDADPADSDWTTELATGNADSTMAFGKRSLTPHPLAKRLLVSGTLLRQAGMDVEGIVRSRLAYKFGISEEKAFLTGSGAGQPLGVFTASSDGISTAQDISTGNTTTSIQFDGLIAAKYELVPQYRANAEWIFHRDAMEQICKLKDGNGQYIWQMSTQAGQPDRLLGLPVSESEYAPNTFTTGLYVGILGDFSYYWIADALSMTVQRLVELYAATNQIGFIGRLECDGMPVLENAFARVTLA